MTETPSPQPLDRNATVAAHRAHQSVWREKVLGWPAGRPTHRGAAKRYPVLGSCLASDYDRRSARDEGPNLMSPAAKTYADQRQQELAALGGLAEDDRLWRNLLSSQPLAFSIAGELREHPEAAARVFSALTGEDVVALDDLADTDEPSHRLGGIEAEWFPPRELHTGDRSAFDLAGFFRLSGDGERLLVSIEVKYVDTIPPKSGFAPSPVWRGSLWRAPPGCAGRHFEELENVLVLLAGRAHNAQLARAVDGGVGVERAGLRDLRGLHLRG